MKKAWSPGAPKRIQDLVEAKEAIQSIEMLSPAVAIPAEIIHMLYSIRASLGANGQEDKVV